MIINNVRIYQPSHPFDDDRTYAVKINGDTFETISEQPLSGDEVIDGRGKVLAPSFNDSHMHLLRYSLLKKELDLTEAKSWKEMKQMVEDHYDKIEQNDWIYGKGFNDGSFDDLDGLLTAEDLNEIHIDANMYFMHQDGHECVISQKALERLKGEEAFKQEPDEFKEKDEHGEWTGRFKDTAVHYIKHHFWGRSAEDAKEALKAGIPFLSRYGITSVHTDDINFIGSYERLWQAYTQLEEEGELPIDVHLHHYIFNIDDLVNYCRHNERRTGQGTDRVRVGAVKIFLDGTQRLFTAAMRNPYPVQPDKDGTLIYTQDQLNEMVRYAGEQGMQVAMHAIGDRAVEQALTALEQPEAETKKLRHRIIHAQTLAPDLIERMRKIKPYVETQPSFLLDEWDKKQNWTPESLVPYCDAYESMLKEHIPLTMSSDLPIGALDPFVTIFTAVNRTDLDGRPEGGWMPQEKISLEAAYTGFTKTPAELEYNEGHKGIIKGGYQADFVLLDQHPEEIKPEHLHELSVLETWHRGQRVYKR
ncbi:MULTISPECIES: amidohydrolase [Halobacillus]|uniref:amidohydrolase n=1 Tax=Halobacillus TaxID=45667 RepID=UPI00136EBF82|nr:MULTISPECIES: amidohydrolase [Halobacillus]MYL28494.1 amidohydrolase family protein [Halobacillus halophilus]MYL38074.1 amidohydrolase family protein [Halobacillus litoralis]